jgi:SulP family sulfate permease
VDGLTVATLMAGVILVIMGIARFGAMIKYIPHPVITGFTSGIAVIIFSSEIKDFFGLKMGAVPAEFMEKWVAYADAFDSMDWTPTLVGPAFTIAMLAAIESLLSAVVADGMIGGRHRSNMELVAQGVANIASAIFGGIPATGAIARTATNVKNGARTPIAGIIHSLTLLVITLFFGRWAALIPMATLAAILVVVSYHMSEWRTFRAELHSPKSDVIVLLATFGLTVFVDLTVAISVGMVLSAFLFMHRMAGVTEVSVLDREIDEDDIVDGGDIYARDPNGLRRWEIPPGVEVYEINGPFFFGAAETFKDTIARVAGKPKVLIIRMRDVLTLDSTGMYALKDVVHRSRKDGTTVLLSDVHMQPLVALTGSPILDEIGKENLYGNLGDALNRARALLGLPPAPPPEGTGATVRRESSS